MHSTNCIHEMYKTWINGHFFGTKQRKAENEAATQYEHAGHYSLLTWLAKTTSIPYLCSFLASSVRSSLRNWKFFLQNSITLHANISVGYFPGEHQTDSCCDSRLAWGSLRIVPTCPLRPPHHVQHYRVFVDTITFQTSYRRCTCSVCFCHIQLFHTP